MPKISFKEYHASKERLRKAGVENKRMLCTYNVTKYRKVPVIEDFDRERDYLSLRPNDEIIILWELEGNTPVLKTFSSGGKQLVPCWSSVKMFEWVKSNCDLVS